MNWTQLLLQWYSENKRDFPWRKSKNPYRVWLSEIILQQTRVEQGLPYYERFVQAFPTVNDLATASEEQVLKLWQGLGYYSRARNMRVAALWIVKENKGKFPRSFKELQNLKGVGDYTASAISSICFNEKQAVVDGNVYRFLSRCFGIETPIDSSPAHKIFKTKAQQLMGSSLPGEFNQAMMEFGALQCTPKVPRCDTCPFQHSCIAFQQGAIKRFPIKIKKTKVSQRFFNYLVLDDPQQKTILQKRTTKGIWQNLYEFPLIETPTLVDQKTLLKLPEYQEWKKPIYGTPKLLHPQPIQHLLSHQRLFIQFWGIKAAKSCSDAISFQDLKQYPVPVVMEHFIEKHYS